MFFIFGWGRQKDKYIGNVFRFPCGNCRNVVDWELQEYSKWFALFFLLVFPYKTERMVICPICNYGYYQNSITYSQIARRAELYESFEKREITLEQFKNKMFELNALEDKEANDHGIPSEEEIKAIMEGDEQE